MALRVVLLGAPGVGKGTQAKKLARQFEVPHISTGDIFRTHVEQGSKLGSLVRKYMENGTLVPDDLTCEVVESRLSEADCTEGYILDGFPRSMPQAVHLTEFLTEHGEGINVAISIDVPDDELAERLCARRFCPACGAIYNMRFNPPSNDERCDRADCGAPLKQRADDTEETVRERLRIYHETTKPILAYYDARNQLQTIPGAGLAPAEVYERIGEVIASAQAV